MSEAPPSRGRRPQAWHQARPQERGVWDQSHEGSCECACHQGVTMCGQCHDVMAMEIARAASEVPASWQEAALRAGGLRP